MNADDLRSSVLGGVGRKVRRWQKTFSPQQGGLGLGRPVWLSARRPCAKLAVFRYRESDLLEEVRVCNTSVSLS